MRTLFSAIVGFALLVALATAGACDAEVRRGPSGDFAFDGSCVSCHAGLHAGQVHASFKLRCIDCHGGNDQAPIPANAASDPALYRDPALVASAHVAPRPELARFFWANGIDDDGDGAVDEGPAFDDLNGNLKLDPGETVLDPGEVAEPGVQGDGVGQFIDSELNRDLDYLRWMNPGDLRVATVGCGSASAAAGAGGGCHQDVVDSSRRSLMANNSAVIAGAYYGNQSWRDAVKAGRETAAPGADPRAGAFGYSFAWDNIDGCIDASALDDDSTGRAQPRFDADCLEALAAGEDPNAAADAPGNSGLPAFQATQGTVTPAPGTTAATTLRHEGAKDGRFPWGGKPIGPGALPLSQLAPPPSGELAPGVPDPVDNVLRGFRAYYPLNFPGSTINFVGSFGESLLPNAANLAFNNPFGRGHASGCTACHMAYDRTGARAPQAIRTVLDDGTVRVDEVVDPTTKHREFDPATQDVIVEDGAPRLVGIAVTLAERARTGREQQRFYSREHKLTTAITTDTCGLCHSFVTRIDHSFRGMAEDEQRDAIARRAPMTFTTPAGTRVRIVDSHVREEGPANARVLVEPEGSAIIAAAKQRDAALAAAGLLPGHGGCAPDVFTEDCNNNGELDRALVLRRLNADGTVLAERTIDEDQNGNGALDLVDRVPRERSVDGRQFKYVYGGANGATRLMDIHFQKGMHCIDCHFLQDSHGDGQLYSNNWDAIEIECEDCHGTLGQRGTLVTSGQNGGNDLTTSRGHDRLPYFFRVGDDRWQRSRVEPGLAWRIPQVDDVVNPQRADFNPRARAAMTIPGHMPDPVAAGAHTTGSTFEGGRLTRAKLECYTCHNAFTYNCMGCHYQMNQGDPVRTRQDGAALTAFAGENETWFNNAPRGPKTDFQLLSFLRGPFVLGVNAAADGGRVAPFRSSMELHVSVNDPDGHTILDDVTFTTWQAKDGNSGRTNVATSGAAMNQTMPHAVRIAETKDCDWCHAVVDQAGRIKNDHLLAQTFGLGANRYPFTGNWILGAGASGLELFDIKAEGQQPGTAGVSRFPGLIVSGEDRVAARVEPLLDGTGGVTAAAFDATDVVLVRNFNPAPAAAGDTAPPTLTDLAIVSLASGSAGRLVIADITRRGHPAQARPSIGNAAAVFVLSLPQPARALAALSPDVSDPYVYVALGTGGLATVELLDRPRTGGPAAALVDTLAVPGADLRAIARAGDVAYVGATDGTVFAVDLADPEAPVLAGQIEVGGAVQALFPLGFMLYVGTDAGLAVLDLADPLAPALPTGTPEALVLPERNVRGLSVTGNRAYLACGTSGVIEVDVTTPAAPVELGDVVPGGETVDARDVIVSRVPGQTWLLVADAAAGGGLAAIKLDGTQNPRERCFPDPTAAGCGADLDFRDPTIMGRDPSFDPVGGGFDAGDPSGVGFFRFAAPIAGPLARLARPAVWEALGTLTGRRLRDSFMPGSGVLSLAVMQRLRAVELCEVPGSPDLDGNGVGLLGFADDAFHASGVCTPM